MNPNFQFLNNTHIEHSFVLQNQNTQQTKIVKACLVPQNGFYDLRYILEQVGDPHTKIFKLYVFQQNKYQDLRDLVREHNTFVLPAAYFQRNNIILIKYSFDTSQIVSMRSSKFSSDNSSIKKQRSKERTIAEIIQIVKQWRQIHTNPINGKKVNLQQAAAMLGISKKSLDDYYYQLRLGEKYDFDFKKNLNEKVGVLRTYIKDVKPSKKNQSKLKTDKHPKKLRIIQEIQEINGGKNNSNFQAKFNYNQVIPENSAENEMDEEKFENKSIKNIQNQFYNDFDYMGDEPQDPFLNFQGNFRRRNEDQISSQQLFF